MPSFDEWRAFLKFRMERNSLMSFFPWAHVRKINVGIRSSYAKVFEEKGFVFFLFFSIKLLANKQLLKKIRKKKFLINIFVDFMSFERKFFGAKMHVYSTTCSLFAHESLWKLAAAHKCIERFFHIFVAECKAHWALIQFPFFSLVNRSR